MANIDGLMVRDAPLRGAPHHKARKVAWLFDN
jgi:hypothetical protein